MECASSCCRKYNEILSANELKSLLHQHNIVADIELSLLCSIKGILSRDQYFFAGMHFLYMR
jgi:hypothetical protein